MSDEPAAKKTKTGWENHKLNINHAVMKADEGRHMKDLAESEITIIQGIGPHAEKVLATLGLKTVKDLATYKYFLMARAIKTLSKTEEDGKRASDSVMNIDTAVDKEDETKTLKELVESPVHVFQGLTKAADELLKELGVTKVGELAELKYCLWAEAIVELGDHEHQLDAVERHKERELKKLA